MADETISYEVTFRGFQYLQGYMARRVFSRNRSKYGAAVAGIVLCAIFLVIAIVINVNPYGASAGRPQLQVRMLLHELLERSAVAHFDEV